MADLEKSSLACACRACYLLFTAVPARGDDPPEPPESPGSGRTPLRGASPRRGSGRYRSVPDRYLRDSARPMSAMEWDELQIPVGLAFFLNSSERGLGGFYPSPAGATECTLDLDAWDRLAATHPLLGAAQPDVEAVLLCREGPAAEAEYFIVPIDVCYELAGRMRMLWKGFDGGSEARASIGEFLAGVRKRAREAVRRAPGMAELVFDCVGARVDRYAAVPSFDLDLRISETSGEKIDAIALRTQIRIEPFRRPYTDAEAQRLHDLFGERVRWADTLKPLQFTTISTMVPGFTGSIEVPLPVPFTYDLQIASTRYFSSLDDGEIPLLLLFSGTIFGSADGRLRVQQVPWSKETTFRLPVSQWREAVDAHFPDTAWITMSRRTLDELGQFKSRHALPTWDATVLALLAQAAQEDS